MDSVTQFALGATVGAAVLGRRVGARSGIIIGGLLGTLPDLDVFVPVADPVASFIGHRGATHSLIVHTLVTPLISEALVRSFAKLRNIRPLAYAAVFFCLTTHALLDAMTVYGTRLFWPIWDEPVGLGSIFIIDPLFSLPLLIVTIWAAFLHQWTVLYGRAVTCALSLSALYLGWTVIGQQIAEARGVKHLKEWGLSAKEVLAGPTPFNSLFWRIISVDGPTYYHVYVPMFADTNKITAYQHERWSADVSCWAKQEASGNSATTMLMDFSDKFYQITRNGVDVVVSDLRMGNYPQFAFRFAVAAYTDGIISKKNPIRLSTKRQWPGDSDWLIAGIMGKRTIRPKEKTHLILEKTNPVNQAKTNSTSNC